MTLFSLYQSGRRALSAAGVEEAAHDAKSLLLAAFGLDIAAYAAGSMAELSENEETKEKEKKFLEYTERRAAREPLQHILHRADLFGYTFYADENALVPRFDTETVIGAVLEFAAKRKGLRVLDLCTGSGCIAAVLAMELENARITGTDISEQALLVAEKNAGPLGVRLMRGDLFAPVQGETFDIIVSNPPYIPDAEIKDLEKEVKDHDPWLALSGGEDGLCFYKRIAEEAGRHLAPGGRLFLEIGSGQFRAVRELLGSNGFCDIALKRDMAGKERAVCAAAKAEEK